MKSNKYKLKLFAKISFVLMFAVIGSYFVYTSHALTGSIGPASQPAVSGTLFYPESYGAVGDGTTDDNLALRKAINAAAGKGTVVLGSKTYYSSDLIPIPSNTTIVGSGPQSVLKFSWSGKSPSGASPYIQNKDINNGGNNKITFSNFTITGGNTSGLPTGSSNAAGDDGLASSVRFIAVQNVTFDHMAFVNAVSNGINVQGGSQVTITNSTFDHQGRSAIVFFWSSAVQNKNITISNNRISYLGDDGIAIAGDNRNQPNTTNVLPDTITISNNLVESWTNDPNGQNQGRGIAILGATNATISNNTLRNLPESAILIRGATLPGTINPATNQPWISDTVHVLNNTINNIGQSATQAFISRQFWKMDGVEVDNGKNITVQNNTISNVVGKPVDILSCESGCQIQGQTQMQVSTPGNTNSSDSSEHGTSHSDASTNNQAKNTSGPINNLKSVNDNPVSTTPKKSDTSTPDNYRIVKVISGFSTIAVAIGISVIFYARHHRYNRKLSTPLSPSAAATAITTKTVVPGTVITPEPSPPTQRKDL